MFFRRTQERNATRFDFPMDMLSRAFDILRRDLAGLQRISDGQWLHAMRFIFTGSDKRLSLITLEPPYLTTAGPYFVDYSVQHQRQAH